MGKAARFACILTPMLCTLASLIVGIVIIGAGTNKKLDSWNNYYLVKIDTRGILDPSNVSVKDAIKDEASDAVNKFSPIKIGEKSETAKKLDLEDFYSSYIWNYCYGDIKEGNKWKIGDCKKSSLGYAFSLQRIVDEKSDTDEDTIQYPDSVRKIQKTINASSKIMAYAYLFGMVTTLATFIIGWFGLLSRWGSCATLLFADAACAFLFIASLCATILGYSLKGAINKTQDEFGVKAYVGTKFISATWVCWLFSFGATVFWLFSTCCCSGRTQRVMGDRKAAKKGSMLPVVRTPYTYERVSSPSPYAVKGAHHGTSDNSLPMHPYPGGTSYEPMRHHGHGHH